MKSLKTSEVAKILNIREHEVRALGDEGEIRIYRTEGKHRRYCSDSVDEYKQRMLGIDVKETVIYILECAKYDYESKIVRLCEILGWNYIVLKEDKNECFEGSEFKRLIEMMKSSEVKRVVISSLEDIGETKFNFIKEISNYHSVQVIDLSELQRELRVDVK